MNQYNENGEKDGEWIMCYPSGKVEYKEFYKNGKLENVNKLKQLLRSMSTWQKHLSKWR